MMRAVVLRRFGGPEVLRVESVAEPVPRAGESLVDVTVAGINYADLGQRAGRLDRPLPAVLGAEVAGRRRTDGRRVAALLRSGGGYAQVVAARDAHTVELPDELDDAQAAALIGQGGTAYAALTLAGRLRPGETVAVTAAAGGVGHLTVQLARALGARRVIGVAATADKREFVRTLGAHATVDPASPDLVARLREAAGGGVDLLVDLVGGALLHAGLRSLVPFGRLVSVGSRSSTSDRVLVDDDLGVPTVGIFGFWMRHVVADRALLDQVTAATFDLARSGRLRATIDRVVPLTDAGAAHAALAARETMGKLLLDTRPAQ
jgi:NADPH2:quinone reductase